MLSLLNDLVLICHTYCPLSPSQRLTTNWHLPATSLPAAARRSSGASRIRAAVTRSHVGEDEILGDEQEKLTAAEAVRAYTLDAACMVEAESYLAHWKWASAPTSSYWIVTCSISIQMLSLTPRYGKP
jgi:hypothetical protein